MCVFYICSLFISKYVFWRLMLNWCWCFCSLKIECSNVMNSWLFIPFFLVSANARLRYKARNMIGAAASRHQRRRASLAVSALSGGGMYSPMDHLRDLDENAPRPPISRRRAVDTSDFKSCAILQTRLKEVKHYPEWVQHLFVSIILDSNIILSVNYLDRPVAQPVCFMS